MCEHGHVLCGLGYNFSLTHVDCNTFKRNSQSQYLVCNIKIENKATREDKRETLRPSSRRFVCLLLEQDYCALESLGIAQLYLHLC